MYYDKNGNKVETPQERYTREKTKLLQIRLNLNTDADILKHLDMIGNKSGYVKELIRRDMSRK